MKNVWYVKNILGNCDGNMYLPILHLPSVELHWKLKEKNAPCDRGPLELISFGSRELLEGTDI